MRRITLYFTLAMIALPLSSFALGFLTINNVQVTQLDAETYRLRAAVDWGGPTILAEDIEAPLWATGLSDAKVNLSGFVLKGPADAFNYHAAVDENIWGAGANSLWDGTDNIRYEYWMPLGYEFGFDFKHTGGPLESLHLDFQGDMEWAYTYNMQLRTQAVTLYDIAYYETLYGSYDYRLTPQIPEPTTLLLFGAGMLGAVIMRRRSVK